MSRWKQKRKRWLDRKSRKENKQRHKRKRVVRSYPHGPYVTLGESHNNHPSVTMKPPKNFSLTNNPEETMVFFADFAREIDRKRVGTHFYIDSREVESATVDALIYLVAILQNDGVNNPLKYSFAGNYPVDAKANRVYVESGFNDYVVSKMRKLPHSNDTMHIICGIKNDSAAAKELSDFIMDNLGKSRREIQPVQKVMIELMSNVYHHAYEKNSFMAKKWYMYAEHIDDFVRCVFVDTGFGISKTARKNLGEKWKSFFGIELDDSKIIRSIFNGDFRTATNEKFRGNGLLSVRENIRKDIFEEFEVISGKGRCIIPKNDAQDEIISICYNNKLYGTLFQFVIR